MTDEETIKKLEELCEYKGYNYTVITDKDVEALHNAIEALRKMDLIKFNVYALNELLRVADNGKEEMNEIEEGTSKIEFKNICIYPTDNENIYVFPTDRELENSEKIRAYCKESLSKCVEFREKYLKSDKEYVRSQARIFEGMAEAYADIIERFFKEADND